MSLRVLVVSRGGWGAVTRQPVACVHTQDAVTLTAVLTFSKSFNPFECHSPHLPSVGENTPSPAGAPSAVKHPCGKHLVVPVQRGAAGRNADTSPGATRMPVSAAGYRQHGTKAPGPERFSETGEPCPASLDIRSAEKAGLRWDWA